MKLLFIGDSNIKPFELISYKIYKHRQDGQILNLYNKENNPAIILHTITGASMYGITKNGRLDVRNKIANLVNDNANCYFLLFGFVDINFVIPYKKIKDNTFDEYIFLENIAKQYIEYIKSLNKVTIILEIPYITINDPKLFEEFFMKWYIEDPQTKEKANKYLMENEYNQQENILLTNYLNNLLERHCMDNSLLFIRYNKYIISKSGIIDKKFMREGNDPHYKWIEVLPIILRELIKEIRGTTLIPDNQIKKAVIDILNSVLPKVGDQIDYNEKYLKYKSKYVRLKRQIQQ